DLDGDGQADLIVFNQVYFGPSAGLIFYGRTTNGWDYLFDCSGALAKIERVNDKLYFRFVVTIIDTSESEILASVVYDFKSKTCSLESKLYYAQQTRYPKISDPAKPFELDASAVLRFSPTINNKENPKDANGNDQYTTTRTLYGNVVAKFPKSAEGWII